MTIAKVVYELADPGATTMHQGEKVEYSSQLSFYDTSGDEDKKVGSFWFGKHYAYKHTVVDVARVTEPDFYVSHQTRVSGQNEAKYLVDVYEEGDAAFSISITKVKVGADGTWVYDAEPVTNYCEIEF